MNKFFPYILLLLIFISSCVINPETELINSKINDLKEKDNYLTSRIEEQNQKIKELKENLEIANKKINQIENKPNKNNFKKATHKSYIKSDTVNVKITMNN
ncbi:hypothetical protein [Rufibacter sp. LB8]|uniref:hypothetical protein n=1 Tax=Rufibacter sp. LB8 TaxID=2777781 RepID=UPI00178C3633|nr:hypothetical protein [Rufibacter sp. LB8]